jgi:adenylate cyclase
MSDVFVSYARSTESQAKEIADALRGEGFSVWRDDEIPAHKPYAEVIEERLRASKAVLVIWSADATKSQWVRAEADAARELGTLIQVTIDGTLPPLPFNQIQCAVVECSGRGVGGKGWDKLTSSVATLVRGEQRPAEAPPRASRPRKNAICVLPFVNMSGDAEQEYFSDGISEDITTDLSKVSALDVIARNTAFTLKGQSLDLSEVARRLNVSHVLEGSVRKSGQRVRISAQLIDGRTGSHLWAERYDRELTDIFAIQDEISKAIVEALKVKLLPDEKKAIEHRGTTSVDAYNLYLMGRKYWVSGNYGDIRREQRTIRLCQRAVEIDAAYAQAWALIALAQVSMHFYFGVPSEDALTSAERALSIDPTIAEAYAVKGRVLSERGDFAGAEREIATALQLGPESWEVNREAARVAYAQRKVDDAIHYYEKAVSLSDSDYHSWAMLVTFRQAKGDKEGVLYCGRMMVAQTEKVLAEDPSNGAALGIAAGGHAILGHRDQAMQTIERALLIDPDNLNMKYNFACVLAAHLHETDAAIELLKPVLEASSVTLLNAAKVDPDLDPLRGNPSFEKMLTGATAHLGM